MPAAAAAAGPLVAFDVPDGIGAAAPLLAPRAVVSHDTASPAAGGGDGACEAYERDVAALSLVLFLTYSTQGGLTRGNVRLFGWRWARPPRPSAPSPALLLALAPAAPAPRPPSAPQRRALYQVLQERHQAVEGALQAPLG